MEASPSNPGAKSATPASALHHSEIIFSNAQQPSMSALLSGLRRTTLTIHNRLTSIQADAEFVSRAAQAFGALPAQSSAEIESQDVTSKTCRPLVANERCGSWYVPPDVKGGSAYFKSTDGHERAWKFSTRRLNLHIVELAENHDGVMIVDSTRRGKRMPDALSTTIPIWCAVLNQVLLPDHPLSKRLFLPPYHSESTHSQITALLPGFVESLLSLKLQLPTCLTKPLRPLWITQDSQLPDIGGDDVIFEDYRPVICCTASRRVVGSEMDEGGYIQGAGDDTENWAHGLTPPVFWSNIEKLLTTDESDLLSVIQELSKQHSADEAASGNNASVQFTPNISVCPLSSVPETKPPSECYISFTSSSTPKETWVQSPRHMQVGLGKAKAASRNLRLALPDICDLANKFMTNEENGSTNNNKIIIACESGKDFSVGTALALSCYLFDEEGRYRGVPAKEVSFTKTLIKSRLGGFMTTFPAANPSRATLQSVNSFLMDWRN